MKLFNLYGLILAVVFLQELNEALQGDTDNAEWFCQRAYAQILLKNYSCKSAQT